MSSALSPKKKLISNQIVFCCVLLVNLNLTGGLAADDLKYLDPENNELGREADGSAYRKDADGTKIVDYIAELELSTLELNRTLSAVQEENTSLQQEIERLKSGRSEFVVESDLQAGLPEKENNGEPDAGNFQDCSSFEQRGQDLQQKLRSCQDSLDLEILAKQQIEVKFNQLQNAQDQEAQASFEEQVSELKTKLQQLLLQKDTRDLLLSKKLSSEDNLIFDKLNKEPQSLSGTTLQDLEGKLRQADNQSDIDQVRTELDQLAAKIQAEIDLLN